MKKILLSIILFLSFISPTFAEEEKVLNLYWIVTSGSEDTPKKLKYLKIDDKKDVSYYKSIVQNGDEYSWSSANYNFSNFNLSNINLPGNSLKRYTASSLSSFEDRIVENMENGYVCSDAIDRVIAEDGASGTWRDYALCSSRLFGLKQGGEIKISAVVEFENSGDIYATSSAKVGNQNNAVCGDGVVSGGEACEPGQEFVGGVDICYANGSFQNGQNVSCTYKNYCGDGKLDIDSIGSDGPEQCDDNQNTDAGCNSSCKLEVPSVSLFATPDFGPAPLNPILDATKSSFARYTVLSFGFGDSINNPAFPYNQATYASDGTYLAELEVENAYSGEIAQGVSRPKALASKTIVVTSGTCGNGILEGNEICDDGGNYTRGCNSSCELDTPLVILTATPDSGEAPLRPVFNATKSSFAEYISFEPTVGLVIDPVEFPYNGTVYYIKGDYKSATSVVNAYPGEIKQGAEIPSATAFKDIEVTTSVIPPNCGDGKLDILEWEQCDDSGNTSRGCNMYCQLEVPEVDLVATPKVGDGPLRPTFDATKSDFAKFVRFEDGLGNGLDNPIFPFIGAVYGIKGEYNAKVIVQNAYPGEISPLASLPYNQDIEKIKVTKDGGFNQFCGNGEIEGFEQCDDSGDYSRGCNNICELDIPVATISTNLDSGKAPFNPIIDATKSNFARYTSLSLGFGDSILNPSFPYNQAIFNTPGDYLLEVEVENAYPGEIRNGVDRPKFLADKSIKVTSGNGGDGTCGNGILEGNEICDDAGNTSRGCNSSCELDIPVVTIGADPDRQEGPLRPRFISNKSAFAEYTEFRPGFGDPILNPTFPINNFVYTLRGVYNAEIEVENAYPGEIKTGEIRPTAVASVGIEVTRDANPGDGVCGNGIVDGLEQCDDSGNYTRGCTSLCDLAIPEVELTTSKEFYAVGEQVIFEGTKSDFARYSQLADSDSNRVNFPVMPYKKSFYSPGRYYYSLLVKNAYPGEKVFVQGKILPSAVDYTSFRVGTGGNNSCGNGILEGNEVCDDGGDYTRGCNSSCELDIPDVNLIASPQNGYPYPVTFNATKSSFATFVNLQDGLGNNISSPVFPETINYNAVGSYVASLLVENAYPGEIKAGEIRPTNSSSVGFTARNSTGPWTPSPPHDTGGPNPGPSPSPSPTPTVPGACGNNVLNLGEECDNNQPWCTSLCTIDTSYGNPGLNPFNIGGYNDVLDFSFVFGDNKVVGHDGFADDNTLEIKNKTAYPVNIFRQFCIKRFSQKDQNSNAFIGESLLGYTSYCDSIGFLDAYDIKTVSNSYINSWVGDIVDFLGDTGFVDNDIKAWLDLNSNQILDEMGNNNTAISRLVRVSAPSAGNVGGGSGFDIGEWLSDINKVTEIFGNSISALNNNFVTPSVGDDALDVSSYNAKTSDIQSFDIGRDIGEGDKKSGIAIDFSSQIHLGKYNGIDNTVIIKGASTNLSTMTIEPGKTYIFEGDVVIDNNLNYSGNISALVSVYGDIKISNNVSSIKAILMSMSGEISSKEDSKTNLAIIIKGALYGELDNLLKNRTRIEYAGNLLNIGTIVNFTSDIFSYRPPILDIFVESYSKIQKQPK